MGQKFGQKLKFSKFYEMEDDEYLCAVNNYEIWKFYWN